jgi:putative membrane protein
MPSMHTAAWVLVLITAALHVWFLSLEIFLWKTPYARRIFGTTPEFAKESAVMAANQGFYNGILAAGLVWSLVQYGVPGGRPVLTFFLIAVICAGIFGAVTASWRILLVQSVPGALALGAVWMS